MPRKSPFTLSVIIPTFNEERNIGRAISSAFACAANEVIVCDGGSSDETTLVAEAQQARVVLTSPCRAIQQNAGAALATGDILLFLHADNYLEKACGKQIQTALSRPDVVGGAFRQRIEASGVAYRSLEWGNSARVRWLQAPYGDQAIFVRRQVFERVGGFPEVPLMEDLLLSRRLRKIGKLALLPGRLHVSARRWQRHGVMRQTLRNWSLLSAERVGIPPKKLARFYPPNKEEPMDRLTTGHELAES